MQRFFPMPRYAAYDYRDAQAALSMVFLIGGVVFVAGIAIAFFAIQFVNSGYGFETVQRLQAAASGGIADALLQLDRNSAFASAGYSVPLDALSATVVVTQGSPATNQATITSASSLGLRSRTLRAVVAIDPTTGQITLLSLQ